MEIIGTQPSPVGSMTKGAGGFPLQVIRHPASKGVLDRKFFDQKNLNPSSYAGGGNLFGNWLDGNR